MKRSIINALPWVTAGVTVFMLLSLHFGSLNVFFFGADQSDVQGVDYFSLPKAYTNLLSGHSMYDTWVPPEARSYTTWYLAHPAFGVFVGFWFAFFSPWTSYWLFVLCSVAMMAYCGKLLAETTDDPFKKRLCYALFLCSFSTFWILFVGNIHAFLVLGLTLILRGFFDLTYREDARHSESLLLAGLLISYFSKPVVLLMMPLLLMLKDTRRTTLYSFLIYAIVSALFLLIPMFNPESIGIPRLAHIAFDFDFIRQNLNIYQNHFVLNEYMKDNSIHWLNLIAQSSAELKHIDVFSFPVFLDTFIGRDSPRVLYVFPLVLCLILSGAVAFVRDRKVRLEASLLLLMAISLTFFLCYNTVWEYQFASVLPIAALLLVLADRGVFYRRYLPLMVGLGISASLPSLYAFVSHANLSNPRILTLVRLDKIVPIYVLFWVMIFALVGALGNQFRTNKSAQSGIGTTTRSLRKEGRKHES